MNLPNPKISDYTNYLQTVAKSGTYEVPESFINLPFDERLLKTVFAAKNSLTSTNLKYFILIGIGGSDLGTKAVYDALLGYYDTVEPTRFPKLIVLDTVDKKFREKVQKLDSIFVNVVSKSGTTLETADNSAYFKIDTVTSVKNSPLWKKYHDAAHLEIPEAVSGRFSVFSAVGLFPLAVLGFDLVKFLEGAMAAVSQLQAIEVFAQKLFDSYQQGKHILTFFFFHPELETLGKWCTQLFAESLGKKGTGFTPITTIGTTDLHSMEQLFLDGPKNKFTLFIKSKSDGNKVVDAVYESVKETYVSKELPFEEVIFDKIDEEQLGNFMMFMMLTVAYLGKLFGVNAFDQPAVEEYKKLAKQKLQIVS